MRLLAWCCLLTGFRQLFLGHEWLAGLGIVLWLVLLGEHRAGPVSLPLAIKAHAEPRSRT